MSSGVSGSAMRIGVLASHPIQYQAPLYRALAQRMDVQVYFAHRQTPEQQAAAGFGVAFDWDIDLLSGYDHEFLPNRATHADVNRFAGCDTPDIADRIRRGRYDAFLLTGWNLKSFWQAIAACRVTRTPVMVRGDSHLGTPRAWHRRLANEITHRAMLRCFDGFLVVGQRHREYLLHYGVSPQRMFDAPHFVDNAWFSERAAHALAGRSALREGLGFGPDDHVVLFVGKLITLKRAGDVVLALARLRHTHTNVRLVVVGSGPLEADVRALVARTGVDAVFVGFRNQSELPAFYALADLLVLPSESETWGLVVNEAMASGLPAVVSDAVGCAPDLLIEGRTGARFPTGDVDALAAAIDRALPLRRDPATRQVLSEVMSRYSLDTAAAGVEAAVGALRRKRMGISLPWRIARRAGSST